jgi:hypothetical protein
MPMAIASAIASNVLYKPLMPTKWRAEAGAISAQ